MHLYTCSSTSSSNGFSMMRRERKWHQTNRTSRSHTSVSNQQMTSMVHQELRSPTKACAHDRTTDERIQMIYAASLLCHRLRASRLRCPSTRRCRLCASPRQGHEGRALPHPPCLLQCTRVDNESFATKIPCHVHDPRLALGGHSLRLSDGHPWAWGSLGGLSRVSQHGCCTRVRGERSTQSVQHLSCQPGTSRPSVVTSAWT